MKKRKSNKIEVVKIDRAISQLNSVYVYPNVVKNKINNIDFVGAKFYM